MDQMRCHHESRLFASRRVQLLRLKGKSLSELPGHQGFALRECVGGVFRGVLLLVPLVEDVPDQLAILMLVGYRYYGRQMSVGVLLEDDMEARAERLSILCARIEEHWLDLDRLPPLQ
jgi:hypothetical protein